MSSPNIDYHMEQKLNSITEYVEWCKNSHYGKPILTPYEAYMLELLSMIARDVDSINRRNG